MRNLWLIINASIWAILLCGSPAVAGSSPSGDDPVFVNTTAENNAWKQGVIDGWQPIKGSGSKPTIPSAPGSIPSHVKNKIQWFYSEGYKRGVQKAKDF